MKVSTLPNTLVFSGILDEETSLDDLCASLKMIEASGAKGPICIDLSSVTYANSAGVVVWLKFAHQSQVPFKYVNAPVWLVNQFNTVRGYFDNGSFVETLNAPYFSPKSQDSRVFTLQLGKDIPILDDYSSFNVPNRVSDGKNYEIDFAPERYFSFISENFQTFKENIK